MQVRHAQQDSMKVRIEPVDITKKIALANLLELYQHDLSDIENSKVELDSTGRYGYKHLDAYWEEKGRFPFFIFADNTLIGFVLVNEQYYISKGAKTMAEFFVLRKYRRQGIGEEAAKQIFSLFPGRWEIGELRGNKNAQSFWRKIIGDYTKGNYKEIELDNERWHGSIQTFDAGNSG